MSDFVKDTPLRVGFHPPEQCARGRCDCRSLAQIISTGTDPENRTFMCVGELRDEPLHPTDKWAFCVKGDPTRDYCEGTDVRFFVDRRDMSHMAAVLSMGLATVIPPDEGTTAP